MARYRKIDPRIWNDEIFTEAEPLHKLLWFSLLTHPMMTPLGAAVIPIGILDNAIGNDKDWCWKTGDLGLGENGAETLVGWFAERSRVVRDRDLIVVKNFLLYNCP